jgi:alpha-tubulin suppressor-like RCC1 family protein/uncharacterized protein YjdB
MPSLKRNTSLCALLVLGSFAAACGGEKAMAPNPVPTIAAIEVTPGADTLVAFGATSQLSAIARDASGNAISGVTFRWTSADPSVATVDSTTGLVTATGNGTAAITASASGVTGQAAVAVAQQVAAVAVTPSATGLSAIGDTVRFTASATDANNNAVTDAKILWISSDPTVATVDTLGLATAKGPGETTVTAAARGVPGNATLSVNQSATQLAFSVEPSNVAAGSPLDPAVQVEVHDANGALVTGSRVAITIGIATNPANGSLGGTKTVNAVSGIATFSGLWIDKAATGYILRATSASLDTASSTAFDVSPGPPAELAFTAQPPASVPVNTVMNPAVTVEIHDAYGNVVPTGQVDMAISSTPWPGATLTGTTSVAAASGVATFGDLQTDRPGNGYTLVATMGSLMASSAPFHATLALTSISAGGSHACGLTASGAAYCWGLNSSGQFGNGLTASDSIPVHAAPTLTFSSISVATFYTCGLSGTAVYCWGNGANGELGDGSFNGSVTPVLVAGGHSFSYVATGGSHACALTTTDVPYCWGSNSSGQLGDNSTSNAGAPVAVSGTYTFQRIAVGGIHTCGLTSINGGYVYCWGANNAGQLGDGTFNDDSIPVLAMSNAAAVGTGTQHTCALDYSTLAAYCWGYNYSGQIGDGTRTSRNIPTGVSPADAWDEIAVGATHNCTENGGAVQTECWGSDADGELGDGTVHTFQTSPVAVFGGLDLVEMTAGDRFTCGRTSTGTVYCWGRNSSGQLGTGATAPVAVPTPIVQ